QRRDLLLPRQLLLRIRHVRLRFAQRPQRVVVGPLLLVGRLAGVGDLGPLAELPVEIVAQRVARLLGLGHPPLGVLHLWVVGQVLVFDAPQPVLRVSQLLLRDVQLLRRRAVALVGEEVEARLTRRDLGGGGAVLVALGERRQRTLLGGVERLAGLLERGTEPLAIVAGLEFGGGVGGVLVERL